MLVAGLCGCRGVALLIVVVIVVSSSVVCWLCVVLDMWCGVVPQREQQRLQQWLWQACCRSPTWKLTDLLWFASTKHVQHTQTKYNLQFSCSADKYHITCNLLNVLCIYITHIAIYLMYFASSTSYISHNMHYKCYMCVPVENAL